MARLINVPRIQPKGVVRGSANLNAAHTVQQLMSEHRLRKLHQAENTEMIDSSTDRYSAAADDVTYFGDPLGGVFGIERERADGDGL